jgi:hypothetical protein
MNTQTTQAIMADMTPFMAKEGLADKWALYGPELVEEFVEAKVAAAIRRFKATVDGGEPGRAVDELFPLGAGRDAFTKAVRETPELLEKSYSILFGPDIGQGHHTLRCDLATGKQALTKAPIRPSTASLSMRQATGGQCATGSPGCWWAISSRRS